MASEVRRNDAAGQYEIVVDGTVAGLTEFTVDGNVLTFPHTEVNEAFAGQGLAKKLVAAALDDVRARGEKVIAVCPMVKGFIEKNSEYADLLV